MLAVHRQKPDLSGRHLGHDQFPGHDQGLLVGQGHIAAGSDGCQGRHQSGRPHHGRHHHVGLNFGGGMVAVRSIGDGYRKIPGQTPAQILALIKEASR